MSDKDYMDDRGRMGDINSMDDKSNLENKINIGDEGNQDKKGNKGNMDNKGNKNRKNKNLSQNNTQTHELGIYIHIPFCVKKCNYCDFLSAPATDAIINRYVRALLTEFGAYYGKAGAYMVPTIFIGGGTPSILEGADIIKIMELLGRVFAVDYNSLEATIEINPGTVNKEKLADYRRAGINRLSFGLQSTNNNELTLLGRIHSYEQFLKNYDMARELGFNNINIDLMSALPGQTLDTWEESLNKITALHPEHISAYSLIIEEGTPFYELYNENGSLYHMLPDEETDRNIYQLTKDILSNKGYHRYEISNYAKKGYECRHNSSYWTGVQYLGFGLGSSSMVNGARFNNISDLMTYISKCEEHKAAEEYKVNTENVKHQEENRADNIPLPDLIGLRENYNELTRRQRMEEFMFLGLRMQKGISTKDFMSRFGCDINSVYGHIINKHKKNRLLAITGDRIYLTEYGINVSNYVLSDFILDSDK